MGRERKESMAIDPDRFLKLPIWAQDEIANKIRTITHLTERIRELSEPESIGDTNTAVHQFRSPDQKLPKGSIIRFDVGGAEVDVTIRDGVLEVRSVNETLGIIPRASNLVEVRALVR